MIKDIFINLREFFFTCVVILRERERGERGSCSYRMLLSNIVQNDKNAKLKKTGLFFNFEIPQDLHDCMYSKYTYFAL